MTSFSHCLAAHMVGVSTWAELPVTLQYRYTDPYEVAVIVGEEGIEWKVSRELLRSGTEHPAGEGDIRFWPVVNQSSAEPLFMLLSSPSGRALFELPRGEVLTFLRRTENVVPTGKEDCGTALETQLRALLDGDLS